MRFIGLGVPESAWPQLLEEACRVLKSGGQLEIVDMSYQLSRSAPSFQHSFTSLLTSYSIPEDPSRAIKFVLPMLDTVLPTTIHPCFQRHLEIPPDALQDALLAWVSSALDYRSSARGRGKAQSYASSRLGWGERSQCGVDQPSTIYAWIIKRR